MFKRLLILFFPIIFCISNYNCNPSKDSKNKIDKNEFEGVITYHEIEKANNGTINTDDTVQLFYANGNYVGVHSEDYSGFHVVKDYYFADKPLRLFLFNTSDTLHRLNLNFPLQKLEGFKLRKLNDQVLSKKCEDIEVNISYPGKDSTTYTDINFIFSRGYLKVDKRHFANWNLGFFNKTINESGAFYLKFKSVHFDRLHKTILSSKTYDAISIKEEAVDPEIFKIDTSMIK